jgi:hypothetical protein
MKLAEQMREGVRWLRINESFGINWSVRVCKCEAFRARQQSGALPTVDKFQFFRLSALLFLFIFCRPN